MLPRCGLMLTRPGETAIRAGAMFRPWGLTLTPTGDTEMSVCTHIHQVEASTLYITTHSSVVSSYHWVLPRNCSCSQACTCTSATDLKDAMQYY